MQHVVTDDGSFETSTGRVLHFGIQRFVDDIVLGGRCFVCGVSRDAAPFNDEHVIPKWLLRRHDLYDRRVGVPNGASVPYRSYTVPCCQSCNSALGEKVEDSLSALIDGGFDRVAERLQEPNDPAAIFGWLALLFVKTHLKDLMLRWHLDHRAGKVTIGEAYDWESLHHVHCVARAFYSGASVDRSVIGTLLLCRACLGETPEAFDYADLYHAKTVLLRTGDICIIAVLNDSWGAGRIVKPDLEKLDGALSILQLRELMARLAVVNMHLRERPSYYSEPCGNGTAIRASLPSELAIDPVPDEVFGALMERCCADVVRDVNAPDAAEVCEHLKAGRWSFLFDASGKFTPATVPYNLGLQQTKARSDD